MKYGKDELKSSLNKKIMLLDKYKREYRYKSDQNRNNKYLWISIIASLVIVALLWYFLD